VKYTVAFMGPQAQRARILQVEAATEDDAILAAYDSLYREGRTPQELTQGRWEVR
jgi:hypothetical protein